MSAAAAPLPPPGAPAPNMNIMPDIVPDMSYVVPEDAIRQFHERGFCILKNFLSEEELQVRCTPVAPCILDSATIWPSLTLFAVN